MLASPELLPVPYTQRLQLPGAPPSVGGDGPAGGDEGGSATVVASASGAVTSAGDPATGDGMENLTQQVGVANTCRGEVRVGWGEGLLVLATAACRYACAHPLDVTPRTLLAPEPAEGLLSR